MSGCPASRRYKQIDRGVRRNVYTRLDVIGVSLHLIIDGKGVDDNPDDFDANGIGVDASDELLLGSAFGAGGDDLDPDVFY